MGHQISALVGPSRIRRAKAREFDLPFFEENGFVIVALDPSHSDFWDEKLGYNHEKVSDVLLDTKCTHFFAKELGLNKFSIIYTDYFGGVGDQVAAAYQEGEQILKPTKNGINKALKKLGVKRTLRQDQFDVLGLGKYRNWDNHFEKYQDL